MAKQLPRYVFKSGILKVADLQYCRPKNSLHTLVIKSSSQEKSLKISLIQNKVR